MASSASSSGGTSLLRLCRLLPFLLLGVALSSAAPPVRSFSVVMDDNYPPYVFRGTHGELKGITIDQWRLWEAKTGIKVALNAMDWSEAVRRMRAGEFDVIDTVFKTDERKTYLDFTPPYAKLQVPIFFRTTVSGITDLESLKGFPVAAKEGDAAVDLLREHGAEPILLFKNYESLVAAAKENKINVFVIDEPPALYYLSKFGLTGEFRKSAPIAVGEFHRAVRRGDTALLHQIEQGFAAIGEPALAAIDQKWRGQEIARAPYPLRAVALAAVGLLVLVALLSAWNWTLARQVRKRTLTLQESDDRLRESLAQKEHALGRAEALLEAAPDPIVIVDSEGRIILLNQQAETTFGYTRTELVGQRVEKLIPERLSHGHGKLRSGYHHDPRVRPMGAGRELFALRKDGSEFPVDISLSPLKTAEGLLVVSTIRDVTERRAAENRIHHLNRVYAVLSDINAMIARERDNAALLAGACRIAVEKGRFLMAWIGSTDGSGRAKIIAHAGASDDTIQILHALISGPRPDCSFTDEALQTGRHSVCNDIKQDPRAAAWRNLALARNYRAMASLPLKAGERIVGTFNLYAAEPGVFDAAELRLLDELAADIGFALEILQGEAERRRAEAELRWRTTLFEAQVDSASDGIVVVDEHGKKIIQNQRLTEIFKIPPEIAGDPDDSRQVAFVTAQTKNPALFAQKVAELSAQPDAVGRDIVELLDGTILERSSSPIRARAGRYYGRIWTFRDITERRKLEDQLRQSQKMEAIGQLAGGIAHDFNNILAAIMMQADVASQAQPVADEAREMLGDIKASTERAANLTRQLLAFSRRTVMQPRLVDVNEIVTSLTKMLRRILGEDIRLHLDLDPHPLITNGDPGMLDQVVLNLVVNSRDAMPSGGQLVIKTGERTLTAEDAGSIAEAEPGRYVRILVTDTGSGIPPEIRSRIFEPFFTTKAPGKGTGLGLATVFGIVRQHGGIVTLMSEVGKGTTFEILLRAESTTIAPTDAPSVLKAKGGNETVLVVEDEAAVRMLTRVILERAGYTVIEAANGPEALRVWTDCNGRPDLLLTDIVMPEGVDGRSLASQLQSRKPGLSVIFTSGYSADIAAQGLTLGPRQDFVQKPCPPVTLLEAVRRVLDK